MDEAEEMINLSVETDIQGYDIDEDMVKIARENARMAGVDKLIHFQRRGVEELHHPKKYGFIITNPPMESVCRIRARCRSCTVPWRTIPGTGFLEYVSDHCL